MGYEKTLLLILILGTTEKSIGEAKENLLL